MVVTAPLLPDPTLLQGLLQQLFPSIPSSEVRHYECGHVVPAESLVALVAGRGPSGLPLSLRHQERGKPEMMDEVGVGEIQSRSSRSDVSVRS